MRSKAAFRRLFRHAVVAMLPFALLLGCGTKAEPAKTMPDQRYEVRGEIVRLPEGGATSAEIWIRHEAIPDFATEEGKKIGMDSMTMPFALSPGLSLDGIAVGDKVAFTLEIRWADRAAPARISRLIELPAETVLSLETRQGQ